LRDNEGVNLVHRAVVSDEFEIGIEVNRVAIRRAGIRALRARARIAIRQTVSSGGPRGASWIGSHWDMATAPNFSTERTVHAGGILRPFLSRGAGAQRICVPSLLSRMPPSFSSDVLMARLIGLSQNEVFQNSPFTTHRKTFSQSLQSLTAESPLE